MRDCIVTEHASFRLDPFRTLDNIGSSSPDPALQENNQAAKRDTSLAQGFGAFVPHSQTAVSGPAVRPQFPGRTNQNAEIEPQSPI